MPQPSEYLGAYTREVRGNNKALKRACPMLRTSILARPALRALSTGAGHWSRRLPPGFSMTKIVATIGPVSEQAAPLQQCVDAGMNIMRINFSYATKDEFHLRRNNLRNDPAGQCVAIMLDTKGPEIRMGGLKICKETGFSKLCDADKIGAVE